jgi:hypothetical protein
MAHFLLTYDRKEQTADVQRFDDAMEAFDAFAILERKLIGDERFEVVLLAAESEEDLRVTHENFFVKGSMLPA